MHRSVIFNCQIEVSQWPSAYLSSMNLRKLAYTLLANKYESSFDDDIIVINEYLRLDKDVKKYPIEIDTTFTDNDFIYSQIFKSEMNSVELNSKLKLLFASISYWLNSGGLQQNKELSDVKNINFVRAFVVSFIKLALIDPVWLQIRSSIIKVESDLTNQTLEWLTNFDNQTTEKENLIKNYFSNHNEEATFLFKLKQDLTSTGDIEYFKRIHIKLDSFCPHFEMAKSLVINKSSGNKMKSLFNLKIIHCLCEYQAIYKSISEITQIVQSPELNLMSLTLFFNGAFLHNFVQELSGRVNPDLYIQEMFGRRSIFKVIYEKLMNIFENNFLINKS
jgi:hypothetical protein